VTKGQNDCRPAVRFDTNTRTVGTFEEHSNISGCLRRAQDSHRVTRVGGMNQSIDPRSKLLASCIDWASAFVSIETKVGSVSQMPKIKVGTH
jgi:hypothetical protein